MRVRASVGVRRLVVAGAAALVLAGCASTPAAPPQLSGTPTRSISVALSVVGCTQSDVCVALGSSTTAAGLEATGEFSTARSRWLALYLPPTATPSVDAVSCATTSCLIGGSESPGDLLWSFDATSHRVSALAGPAGGAGVEAVACHEASCALIDAARGDGTPRWATSTDGGLTWSTPSALTWAAGDAVTALTCVTAYACLVAAHTPGDHVILESTTDAGLTWSSRSTPSAWTALSSLWCTSSECVGLARDAPATALVSQRATGGRWRTTALEGSAASLACVRVATCVAVGGSATTPWLTLTRDRTLESAALRYVPTALIGVACGASRCAAIGDTTLVDVPSDLLAPPAPSPVGLGG